MWLLKKVSLLFIASLSTLTCTSAGATPTSLNLTITAPTPLAHLQQQHVPAPVYLEFSTLQSNQPIYSAAVVPGINKEINLAIPADNLQTTSRIRFVDNIQGKMTAMSLSYGFAPSRLQCLLNKKVTVQVRYDINTHLIDVSGIPVDC